MAYLDDKRTDLNRLAHELVEHLPGWSVVEDRDSWNEVLAGPNGWKIYMAHDRYGRNGRLRFSPDWPSGHGNGYVGRKDLMPYDERKALEGKGVGEITVAGERGMAAIAKDISRRLFPVLEKWHDKIAAEVKRRADEAHTGRAVAMKIVEAVGGDPNRNGNASVSGTTASIRAYASTDFAMDGEVYEGGTRVSFRLRETWPTEDVLRLIAFVKSDFGRSAATAA